MGPDCLCKDVHEKNETASWVDQVQQQFSVYSGVNIAGHQRLAKNTLLTQYDLPNLHKLSLSFSWLALEQLSFLR